MDLLRRGEHRGNKADQIDAGKLSHRLLTSDLRAVFHGSSDRATLQELTRSRWGEYVDR